MSTTTRYSSVTPYTTKDGSQIRELMNPQQHGSRAQSLAEATIFMGKSTTLHLHRETEEIYHVVGGRGIMTLGEERFPIARGDTILIPPGTPHCVSTVGTIPLRILCQCSPAYSHEDTVLLEDGRDYSGGRLHSRLRQLDDKHMPNVSHLLMRWRTGPEIAAFRKARGLTLAAFWGCVGLSSNMGKERERYEDVPIDLLVLLNLAHGLASRADDIVAELRTEVEHVRPMAHASAADFQSGERIAALRRQMGLSQSAFWGRAFVSQSAASHYEGGRGVPVVAQQLLCLAYVPDDAAADHLASLRAVVVSEGRPTL